MPEMQVQVLLCAPKPNPEPRKRTMTATATKISVNDMFGYRKVVEVSRDTVTFVNLNGRKLANGQKKVKDLPRHTVSMAAFRKLVGI